MKCKVGDSLHRLASREPTSGPGAVTGQPGAWVGYGVPGVWAGRPSVVGQWAWVAWSRWLGGPIFFVECILKKTDKLLVTNCVLKCLTK